MKRSEINRLVQDAQGCFRRNGWVLPPEPKWDVTDFGLGDWRRHGLVLVNLAEEPEYCEKLMYAKRGMRTPMHHHKRKKEDIICRSGEVSVEFENAGEIWIKRNGHVLRSDSPMEVILKAGERVTIEPGLNHAFWPLSEEAILGEVSTANDDMHDNFFVDPAVGRFGEIEEDEPAIARLVAEPQLGS